MRHKPYGKLNPFQTPRTHYYTQTGDWITKLPPTLLGINMLLTLTCKASKKMLLVTGKETQIAAEQGAAMLNAWRLHDQNFPTQFISDRDPCFLLGVMKGMFDKLSTKMLTSTAYYPQTDRQSERTNQTVEIALRYFVTANPGNEQIEALLHIQSTINNSCNASTGVALNKVI